MLVSTINCQQGFVVVPQDLFVLGTLSKPILLKAWVEVSWMANDSQMREENHKCNLGVCAISTPWMDCNQFFRFLLAPQNWEFSKKFTRKNDRIPLRVTFNATSVGMTEWIKWMRAVFLKVIMGFPHSLFEGQTRLLYHSQLCFALKTKMKVDTKSWSSKTRLVCTKF